MRRSRRPKTSAVPTTTGATPQRGQREPGLQPGEQDDAAHQRQDLAGELGDLVAQDALQQPDVGREPAGELAGAPLGEEARRHLQQLGEQLAPESRHRPLAGRAQQIGLHVVEHRPARMKSATRPMRDAVQERAVAVARTRRPAGTAPPSGRPGSRGALSDRAMVAASQHAAIRPHPGPQPDQPAGPGKPAGGDGCGGMIGRSGAAGAAARVTRAAWRLLAQGDLHQGGCARRPA